MTDVQSARTPLPRKRRLLAGLTTAGVVGALVTPALTISPAAAAPICAEPAPYGAMASADLVKLGLLDLHALGHSLGPVADLRIASTASGLNATGAVRSQAGARQIDANLLGAALPLGALTKAIYQQAPPPNPAPATANTLERAIGPISLGVGELKAHATWIDGMECGESTGTATDSSSTILGLRVLPGPNGQSLVHLPGNLTSATTTALTDQGSVATASIGAADIRLFAGTTSQITVKVIKPPTLRVSTAGTRDSATVDYTSPILEISGPGIPPQRLDAPGKSIELALPSSLTGAAKARSLAESQSLPLIPGAPLDGLVRRLNPGQALDLRSKGGQDAPLGLPDLGALPNLPSLPPAGGAIGESTEAAPADSDVAIIRLSLGKLEQRITDEAVSAQAASLRLQVLLAGSGATGGGYGGGEADGSSVVDLGVGLLEAAAVAPLSSGGGGVADEEEVPGDEEADGGVGAGLPVTGASVGVFVGTGLLLVVGGGTLLLLGRRRRLS